MQPRISRISRIRKSGIPIREIRATIRKSLSFLQRILGRDFGQVVYICLSGGKQGGNGRAGFLSQPIAVGSADFLDQTMCSEQS